MSPLEMTEVRFRPLPLATAQGRENDRDLSSWTSSPVTLGFSVVPAISVQLRLVGATEASGLNSALGAWFWLCHWPLPIIVWGGWGGERGTVAPAAKRFG